MTLSHHFSVVLDKNFQSLQCLNRKQQSKIAELEKQNAILHLRLAAAMQSSQFSREQRDEYFVKVTFNNLQKVNFKEKLQNIEKEFEKIKADLINLSEDIKEMFGNIRLMFERFYCDVVKKIRHEQEYKQCNEELSSEILDLRESLTSVREHYLKERERRKELHNTLVEVQGNIRVHCRVRPMLEFDIKNTNHEEWTSNKVSDLKVSLPEKEPVEEVVHACDNEVVSISSLSKSNKIYEFERVYSPQDDQVAVFKEIQPLITSFLDGYNVCVMAYGQTGSGKSHSMLGTNNQPGIVPRAAEELFRLIDERGSNVSLEVSVAEVYNNDIFDLLSDNPTREKHTIVTSSEGSKDVPTLIYIKVENACEIEELIEHGLQHRAQIATKVHEHSSRSHLIVSITATFQEPVEHHFHSSALGCRSEPSTPRKRPNSTGPSWTSRDTDNAGSASKSRIRRQLPQPHPPQIPDTAPTPSSCYSVPSSPICPQNVNTFRTKLQLVDLAGSECVGLSGATGSALRESSYINRSLSALADVLGALSENRSHVPYRNSRLTHLLQDSIGGEAKMLVLLCVSPAKKFVTETMQCLGFGNRARQVQRGQTKRRGYVARSRSQSPGKLLSPRRSRSALSSVVRRVLN